MSFLESSRTSIVAVVIRLAMVLSVWQGPMLWVHQHSRDWEGIRGHLAQFHPDDGQAIELGWHWHLSLLGAATPSPDGLNQPPERGFTHSVLALAESSPATPSPELLSYVVLDLPTPCVSPLPARAPLAFMATFGPGRSPQQLLHRFNC